MKRNSKLSLALHALAHMAGEPGRARTSAEIAAHNGTNPVVVRRVLGLLRKAGLLESEKGHSGGWRLAVPPRGISLADVYLALGERLIQADAPEDELACAVEHELHGRVTAVMQDVEHMLIDRLSATSIEDVAKAGK